MEKQDSFTAVTLVETQKHIARKWISLEFGAFRPVGGPYWPDQDLTPAGYYRQSSYSQNQKLYTKKNLVSPLTLIRIILT